MLRASEGDMRYPVEVARLLWPEPWEVSGVMRRRHSSEPTWQDSYVFPGPSRPRLLMPAEVPAASSMLQRLGNDRSLLMRVLRGCLVHAVRSPVFPLLRWPMLRVSRPGESRPESIETYLGQHLGGRVRVGVVLGTPRANRKPVLQVFGCDGRLLGFAKVGHNDLTAPLVRREAAALAVLGRHRPVSFAVPRLLHTGRWHELEVLVMSPLAGEPLRDTAMEHCWTAMRAVARLRGTSSLPLRSSGFWARLRKQVEESPDTLVREQLTASMASIEHRWGDQEVELGAWHGDWGHWNMALDRDVVQVWDWERFDTEVPLGFDGLHYAAQRVRPEGADLARQQRRFRQDAQEILAKFDVPSTLVRLTLVLYLLEMGVRYAHALSHSATPVLQHRRAWVASMLAHELASHDLLDTSRK